MTEFQELQEMKYVAAAVFAVAVVHTFSAKLFNNFARRFKPGSVAENFFHFLGEIEIIFGLWASILIAIWSARYGTGSAISFLESIDYTEPLFVFVIMCMSATRPVLNFCKNVIDVIAKILPVPFAAGLYVVTLTIGPLLGSLITEPAAMTVTALLLRESFFGDQFSLKFKYATLGLLFVNISVGGTLTHFAAPPVLMVAGPWGWDSHFMFSNFGPRVIPAIVISAAITAFAFRKEIMKASLSRSKVIINGHDKVPNWITVTQLAFMALTIAEGHHIVFFVPLLLIFLGWCSVTKEYQDDLKIKESLLVAFFLGGLVTLGKLQDWWLQPILSQLGPHALFFGATTLTAFTDNAALTYLGTLVPGLSDAAKFLLVAGAVTGGGLTVIANAPNPAGYNILQTSFGEDGISPIGLLLGALPFTLVVAAMFLLF
jgi:hypothetical protein